MIVEVQSTEPFFFLFFALALIDTRKGLFQLKSIHLSKRTCLLYSSLILVSIAIKVLEINKFVFGLFGGFVSSVLC